MSVFKTVIVKEGQSLSDISIQEYGTIEGVFAIMVDNYLKLNSINDVLPPSYPLNIRVDNPYGLNRSDQGVTNGNARSQLSTGYVLSGYVVSGYAVTSAPVLAKIKSGISEYQLELIN
jgi:hypothetical protein